MGATVGVSGATDVETGAILVEGAVSCVLIGLLDAPRSPPTPRLAPMPTPNSPSPPAEDDADGEASVDWSS